MTKNYNDTFKDSSHVDEFILVKFGEVKSMADIAAMDAEIEFMFGGSQFCEKRAVYPNNVRPTRVQLGYKEAGILGKQLDNAENNNPGPMFDILRKLNKEQINV